MLDMDRFEVVVGCPVSSLALNAGSRCGRAQSDTDSSAAFLQRGELAGTSEGCIAQ